jgi:putative transport protein
MLSALLADPLTTLLLVIGLGLLLGRVQVCHVSLGSSGVLFVALLAGHLGYSVPNVDTIGVILFVYCVGLNAGPGFFHEMAHRGTKLAKLALVVALSGALAAYLVGTAFDLPADLVTGVFAGALTSTPALAAATSAAGEGSSVAVGFGIGYVVGIVGVVLFLQGLPALMRADLRAIGEEEGEGDAQDRAIVRALIEVQNPSVHGKRPAELPIISDLNCQVSRVLRDGRLMPLDGAFTFANGDEVMVVGQRRGLESVVDLLGRRSARADYLFDTENQRMRIVVSSREVDGRSLEELRLRSHFGVTISRIMRHDKELVPKASDTICYGDVLSAVGQPADLERFKTFAGHRARSASETDLISVSVGMVLGVILGSVSFELFGLRFSLGVAGGPLVVALLLGHFGRIGRITGHVPLASRLLLNEVGLSLLLAAAGVDAGRHLQPIIAEHGLTLLASAVIVAFVPMVVGVLAARFLFKLDLLATLGALAGSMTSTPGLGAITDRTDSNRPVVTYAAIYPVALILMTILAPILLSSLG